MHYVAEAAHARRVRDRAHEKVKIVRSELITEAKTGNVERLGSNPTAQVVEAYYREHADHKQAKDALADAEYDVSMAEGAIFAMNHRRYALENVVRLIMGELYSVPIESRDLAEWAPMKTRVAEIAEEEHEELDQMMVRGT
jgi:hypothetical protein